MHKLSGMDEAVEVLRPYWKEFDDHFEQENRKFRELADIDHSILGRVIKCHLISEIYIDKHLQEKLSLTNLADAQLSYRQKVVLLPEFRSPVLLIKPGLLKLNKIRNKCAHDLTSDVSADELQPMTEILEISRRNVNESDPISVIEQFTTLSCTFLLMLPPHLQDAFSRAFRNIQVQVEDEDN